jgi:hypothetical protein
MQKTAVTAAALCLVSITAACATADPRSDEVNTLIGEMLRKDSEQQAFQRLEALGNDGVPYMVGHLDDLRPLPEARISLVNYSPKAFEGIRHYGPKTVHDALSAILNQVTRQHFEFVYNGATNEVRAKNTAGWRAWCVKSFPEKAVACNGAV